MKMLIKSVAVTALVLLPAVAFAQKVNVDFDPAADFTKAAANPNVAIATHLVTKEEKEVITTGYGYGGGYYRYGGGMGTTTSQVNSYTTGTLVLDIYDAATKKLAWRGTGTDTASDKADKNAKKVQKALDKMFKQYPPAKPKEKP